MKLLKTLILSLIILSVNLTVFTLTGCSKEKIKLYDISSGTVQSLNIEDYVAGVVAAEIDESFSTEAIKAQSVVARTFTYWFKNNNLSKYEGADISNDISEAQAYTTIIPDKIKKAVKETKGLVLKQDNNLFLPYFCANCGGFSSLASDIFGSETNFSSNVETLETETNSKNYSWTAQIDKSSILYAMQNLGYSLASVNSFEIGKIDSSGRAITFVIGGININANTFRLQIGSTILKSCKLTNIDISTNDITFSGLGYGHGVGLSQWGANILANSNYTYNNILLYYYKNAQIVEI